MCGWNCGVCEGDVASEGGGTMIPALNYELNNACDVCGRAESKRRGITSE